MPCCARRRGRARGGARACSSAYAVPGHQARGTIGCETDCVTADAGVREAVADRLLAFWRFFQERAGAARGALTVRDLLAWAGFVAAAAPRVGALAAYAHGAHLALLDGVGLGLGVPQEVRARAPPGMAMVCLCLPLLRTCARKYAASVLLFAVLSRAT